VASKDAAKKKAARPRKPPAPPACRVVLGDCVEVMASLPDESIDAIVCDPPYGLEFMGKDWDSFRIDKRAARWSGDERTGGAGAGFGEIPGGSRPPSFGKRRTTGLCRTCGKRDAFRNPHACGDQADWVTIPVDDSPMEMRAFQNWVALWAVEAYRVLKPGGHLLAFGGTRTYHRLACGVEEAGFDIRDSLHWIYGSGFPKSLDVGKSIDAKLGAVREPVGQGENFGRARIEDGKVAYGDYAGTWDITKPSSDEAVTWDGWGTALKPAHEPIVLARKPLAGTVVETVLAHGTGALNVQAARVGDIGGQKSGPRPKVNPGATSFAPHAEYSIPLDAGRWPANVVLSHLDECKGSGPNHTATRTRRRHRPQPPPDRQADRPDAVARPPRHASRRRRPRPVPRLGLDGVRGDGRGVPVPRDRAGRGQPPDRLGTHQRLRVRARPRPASCCVARDTLHSHRP
jgi:hypothetical protein